MENYLSIVSSRGILRSCNIHSKAPRSSYPILDFQPSTLYPGGSIYVCTDALEDFVARLLPNLNNPFVLVSGDSDRPIDDALLATDPIRSLLNSPLLIRWFAQNLLTEQRNLFHLPIGLDYHTAWERPSIFEINPISPFAQERVLLQQLDESPPIERRNVAAYCNWSLTANRGDRMECLQKVGKDTLFVETQRLERHITWARQAKFAFVASPAGEGADCHRTWEAIMTGSIPIVKLGGLSPLFDVLPVAKVRDWSEVTKEWLQNILEEFTVRRFDFTPLFLGYWQKRLQGVEPEPLALMTIAEFRHFITARAFSNN